MDLKYIKIEDFPLVRGKSYLIFPHHKVLPFGNTDDELEGNDCDYKFWEWYDDSMQLARPYPTHVCELPEPPIE